MEVFEAIFNRRSIRKYTDKKISKESIDKLLAAAMVAPSAMNTQAWQFLVLNKREIIDSLVEAIPHAGMVKEADAAIMVCADESIEKDTAYNLQNTAASIQNILLAAHAIGLGACWIAVHPLEDVVRNVKKLFNLPVGILPVAVISLGFPGEELKGEDRFNKGKVHYNRW
ncbi:MAG: nitroreductase family protein [Ignavibacteria bacterium CG_4_9_14_3_um_filter_36_18]|nr:nitroreductase family protein [Ignavibacteria bacterium]PJB00264.1 MAG: nitroreductase family protein [Ignavibacteria bacterium CG_4_9_14_3_um_filter_36_18]